MKITNYVRRCKHTVGSGRYDKLHAADNTHTFCGKELNEMWFVEGAGLFPEDITCKDCLRVMRNNP